LCVPIVGLLLIIYKVANQFQWSKRISLRIQTRSSKRMMNCKVFVFTLLYILSSVDCQQRPVISETFTAAYSTTYLEITTQGKQYRDFTNKQHVCASILSHLVLLINTDFSTQRIDVLVTDYNYVTEQLMRYDSVCDDFVAHMLLMFTFFHLLTGQRISHCRE
jgi:hypothetical protein